MRRTLVSTIPLFVAAAVFALASPVISAQQEHNHSPAAAGDHACACCGNSGTGAMNHAAGNDCCGEVASGQAPAAAQGAAADPQAMDHGAGGCCGSMAMGKGEGSAMTMPMGSDPSMMADMQVLHFLLGSRADIRRIVAVLPNGIDTLTESDKPEIVAQLKTHVAAMYSTAQGRARHPSARIRCSGSSSRTPIRSTRLSATPSNGVRVVETSADPAVAKLLHKHAEAVDAFIKNGMSEMMKNHPID